MKFELPPMKRGGEEQQLDDLRAYLIRLSNKLTEYTQQQEEKTNTNGATK